MNMETISIAIDTELREQVDELTQELDCTRSTLVRFLIDDYLKYYSNEICIPKNEYVNELRKHLAVIESEEKEHDQDEQ